MEALATTSPILWLVVPCYNEAEVLPISAAALATKMEQLVAQGAIDSNSRILFVDDGSSDTTWELIAELHEESSLFAGISLAHNAGHQNALYAGMMEALAQGADCAITLDADLQDDVDALDKMLTRHAEGAEIVYGVRSNRDVDTSFKRNSARLFYKLMEWLGVELVADSADFRLVGRRALEALSQYQESHLFLRGILPSLGFSSAEVYYERKARVAGQTKYPSRKMLSLAADGITSFSVAPIRVVTLAGLLSIVVSTAMVLYALISKITGHVVSGWTSLMVSLWFVGGMILVSLGVVGEYVGKAYIETKARPRYLIEHRLLDKDSPHE